MATGPPGCSFHLQHLQTSPLQQAWEMPGVCLAAQCSWRAPGLWPGGAPVFPDVPLTRPVSPSFPPAQWGSRW